MWLDLERKTGSRAFINTARVEAITKDKSGCALFLFPGDDQWIAVTTSYEEVIEMMSAQLPLDGHFDQEWRDKTGCDTPDLARAMIESMKEANRELRADNMKEFQAGIQHERVEAAKHNGQV
jgi:phytoene dehydrogenase-like protein